ncbi:uncharacterized protein RJT20DRAFT_125476, partial [Scheffersomyces xylosifermentans]|uniref:uncharacterized protein n=1 Tax=Scheffersomyces xylosifermentans TaxID=1304137 RepID=UPI00315D8FDF
MTLQIVTFIFGLPADGLDGLAHTQSHSVAAIALPRLSTQTFKLVSCGHSMCLKVRLETGSGDYYLFDIIRPSIFLIIICILELLWS